MSASRSESGLLDERRAGVLLHPTSLPDADRGALGQAARSFVDWLSVAGFTVWQVLPLGPVGDDRSPYFARSNHAGDPGLVDLQALVDLGLVPAEVLASRSRSEVIGAAAARLAVAGAPLHEEFVAFRVAQAHWLPDYALFFALSAREAGRPWWAWPTALRDRDPVALATARGELDLECLRLEAEQFFFHTQWRDLRRYAAERGVKIFGDLPIYLAPDSVEVWAHRELFELDGEGRPIRVAGVPPDYFSKDGQLWGNPLYRWSVHERSDFAWWVERLRAQFEFFDIVRIDHFRGLEAYWAVPCDAPTAATGEWCLAPGAALLDRVRATLGPVALVAEDLGVITPAVEALRDAYALPGIRVVQFGFDGNPDNLHAPFRWTRRVVGYTGTHDNDTSAGWYAGLDTTGRARVRDYLGVADEAIVPSLVRTVLASVADLAIVPMQDLLGLGTEARMNLPGTVDGNWRFAFRWTDVPGDLGDRLRHWNHLYGRVR